MTKIFLIILAVIAVLVILAYILMPRGAKYADYEFLIQPRLTTMPAEKVIEIKSTGDPLTTVQPAFGLLYKTYYKLDGVKKGPKMPAPKARWIADPGSARETWEGHFALTVPEATTLVSGSDDATGLKVELTTWEYGEVAEILHVGSYENEEPTFNKLVKFIKDSGYETTGPHEEEYLKGPMPFMPSNPKKFLTIIRYNVRKKGLSEP